MTEHASRRSFRQSNNPSATRPSTSTRHLDNKHRVERNYLRHRDSDANKAILAAVGYKDDLLIEVREADDAAWTWHWNGWNWSGPRL
jgi:hypothetical protein